MMSCQPSIVYFYDKSINGRLCRAEWWRRGECVAPDEDNAFLGEVSLRMAWYANTERIWCEIVVCIEGLLQGVVHDMAV